MNWLKRIWECYRPPENRDECVTLFKALCISAGVSPKDLKNGKVLDLFAEWYAGPCNTAAIQKCISQFKEENPAANAKLGGKL